MNGIYFNVLYCTLLPKCCSAPRDAHPFTPRAHSCYAPCIFCCVCYSYSLGAKGLYAIVRYAHAYRMRSYQRVHAIGRNSHMTLSARASIALHCTLYSAFPSPCNAEVNFKKSTSRLTNQSTRISHEYNMYNCAIRIYVYVYVLVVMII